MEVVKDIELEEEDMKELLKIEEEGRQMETNSIHMDIYKIEEIMLT